MGLTLEAVADHRQNLSRISRPVTGCAASHRIRGPDGLLDNASEAIKNDDSIRPSAAFDCQIDMTPFGRYCGQGRAGRLAQQNLLDWESVFRRMRLPALTFGRRTDNAENDTRKRQRYGKAKYDDEGLQSALRRHDSHRSDERDLTMNRAKPP